MLKNTTFMKAKKMLSVLMGVIMLITSGIPIFAEETATTEYTISTLKELQAFSEDVNSGTSYDGITVKLMNNIDMSGCDWTPIGNNSYAFTGTFDGNFHTIYNLSVNTATRYCGLFGKLENATIKNLGIENATIVSSTNDVAVLAGNAKSSEISRCYVTGTVEGKGGVSGLLGSTHNPSYTTKIENCYARVAIVRNGSYTYDHAGISGWNYSKSVEIKNCYSACTGEIRPIAGWSDGQAVPNSQFVSTYFDATLSPNFSTASGRTDLGRTSDELKTQSTFEDWDFDTVWTISSDKNGGYPYLRGFTPGLGGAPSSVTISLVDGDNAPIEEVVRVTIAQCDNPDSELSLSHNGSNVYSGTVTTADASYDVSVNNHVKDTITQSGTDALTHTVTVDTFNITAAASAGGTVSGGGKVIEGASTTLTAAADEGYTFDGWYDGENKVCDTAEFVVENVSEDKTYTAKFTKIVYYTISAEVGTDGGGTVSGGREVLEGGNVTLTATADDGYTFDGWYDGENKVCDTLEFTIENVTADKTYTAKFTKNQVIEPDPSEFDFTTIRTLRAKDIVVDHKAKTITMTADGNVRNIAVYHDQLSVIPGGTIKLADAQSASIKQNSGSFYIINNVGNAVVTVDVTIGEVTKQYTLSVNFNEFVAENLRMYQRKLGSTQKDIVYGTDVGYVVGNEIYITPNAGIEYIGLTKYQGTPGNYNGIITPVGTYPTYSTFEESTSSNEPVFVDWQGCIFVKRPTDGGSVEIDVNYTLGTETSVYKVIVDFTEETEFAFSSIRSARAKNVVIDHAAKTITMDSDGRAANIAVYKYQLGEQSDMQVTLADKMNADIAQNISSFYIKNDGTGSASVLIDVSMGGITKQYTLTVNFEDGFDFTDIRTLRAKNAVVDHENKTITVDTDGRVANIAVYKAQNDIIKDGSIVIADAMNASVVQNSGSFYIKDDGTGSAAVLIDITIGKVTKQYTLNVNFSDGFDFDEIRTLRASEIKIDHDTQKITITASKGAQNVALYMLQTNAISGGKLTLTDEQSSKVQKNPGSYYIIKQDGIAESTVSADITIGGKTKTYEITVCFTD